MGKHMKRLLAFSILLLGYAFFSAAPASAYIESVGLTNKTDKCAWITVYFSDALSPWSIYPGTPGFLKPGQSIGWGINKKSEIKIRAEVKAHADCSGPTIADTYDVRKTGITSQPSHPTARIQHDSNGYHLWFY
jgi:hypothetical protein